MGIFLNYQTDDLPAKSHKKPYRRSCYKCKILQFRHNNERFLCGFCKNKNKQPHNWGSIKKSLFKERGEKCEICDRVTNIHIHHKDRNRENNNKDNLLIVCVHCHLSIHRNWGKKLVDVFIGRFGTRLKWEPISA